MDARFSTAVEILVVVAIEGGANLTSHEIAKRLKTDSARVRQIFSLLGGSRRLAGALEDKVAGVPRSGEVYDQSEVSDPVAVHVAIERRACRACQVVTEFPSLA